MTNRLSCTGGGTGGERPRSGRVYAGAGGGVAIGVFGYINLKVLQGVRKKRELWRQVGLGKRGRSICGTTMRLKCSFRTEQAAFRQGHRLASDWCIMSEADGATTELSFR